MAVTTSTFIHTMAQAASLASPYLTEGAVKIDKGQLVGKRVGGSYDFTIDVAGTYFSDSGMVSGANVGSGDLSSITAKIKIANAGSPIKTGALVKALEVGDWEKLTKDTGVAIINKMAEETALRDLGKVGSVVTVTDAAELQAKANRLNKFKGDIYGYGDYDAIAKVLTTSKKDCPAIMDDSYVAGESYKVGFIKSLRNITLPANATSGFSADKVAVDMDGGTGGIPQVTVTSASATKIEILAGTMLKVSGKDQFIVFLSDVTQTAGVSTVTKTTTDVILIGIDADVSTSSIDTSHIYSPIILRVDGSQGFVDAAELVEAADAVENEGGVGIAHTEIKNSNRGVDHYFDCVGAYGIVKNAATMACFIKLS